MGGRHKFMDGVTGADSVLYQTLRRFQRVERAAIRQREPPGLGAVDMGEN